MTIMPLTDYKRLINAMIGTVITAVILSFGSFAANHFNTKFQVRANKTAIETHVKEVKELGFASRDYVNTAYFNAKEINEVKVEAIKERTNRLEKNYDEIMIILIEIKGRLPK